MLERLKAMGARIAAYWNTAPLLQKSVTVPAKLVLVGTAIGVLLVVMTVVRHQTEPRVMKLLGVKTEAPIDVATLQKQMVDGFTATGAFQSTMITYAGEFKAELAALKSELAKCRKPTADERIRADTKRLTTSPFSPLFGPLK